MKQKLSVTIDGKLISDLKGIVQNEEFRNKSHLVEVAIKRFVEERK